MDTKISATKPGLVSYLEKMIPGMKRLMPGGEVEELNVQVDHIHMIMIIPRKYSVSDVIGRIKGGTASNLRKKFRWLVKVYWKENIVWSPGFFVSTIGFDEEQIKRYVKWQGDQDSGQAKLAF